MNSIKSSKSKKKLGSYPYLTVMFSITLALFVMGLFGLIFVHARKLSQIAQENIEMKVFLTKNIQVEESTKIQKTLQAKPYVLKINNRPQVKFVSEDEAKKQFIKSYGHDFTKVLTENPLHSSYVIKIAPQYSDSTNLGKISHEIKDMVGVQEVFYMEDLILKVNKNIRIISIVLLSFALILVTASILLINNTIKLALYSQRFLIRSMQLVGATKWFIQKPFIIRALLQGFFSGIIAAAMLFFLLNYAYAEIPSLQDLKEQETIIIVLSSLLVLGALIGFISSQRAVNKYLKMSLDELY